MITLKFFNRSGWFQARLLTVFLTLGLGVEAAEVRYEGHFDANVAFTNGVGWAFNFYDFSDGSRVDTRLIDAGVSNAGQGVIPAGGEWQPLGATAGSSFWRLPETLETGVLFLGFRTEDVDPDPFLPFFGLPTMAMRLLSVRGSGMDRGGHFSMYQTDSFGTPFFHFTTSDGIGSGDLLSPITMGAHAHYNWAFTAPGEYHVTFQSEANYTLDGGNQITNGVGTFTFYVPGETNLHVAEKSEVDVEIAFSLGQWEPVSVLNAGIGLRTAPEVLVYGGENLRVPLPADAEFSGMGAAGSDFWVFPQVPDTTRPGLGLDGQEVPVGQWVGDLYHLELQSIKGPVGGAFMVYQTDGFGAVTPLMDTSDGVDPVQDRIPLIAGTHAHHHWGFNRRGVYQLTFTTVGTALSGGAVVRSDPFVIRVGVDRIPGFVDADGNGLDDHWEFRHGFSTAAVPDADPDADGRVQLLEYLEDTYHDVSDSGMTRLRTSQVSPRHVSLEWQTLEGRAYQVHYSDDLLTWFPLTGRIIGGRTLCRIVDDGSFPGTTAPGSGRFYRLDVSSAQ